MQLDAITCSHARRTRVAVSTRGGNDGGKEDPKLGKEESDGAALVGDGEAVPGERVGDAGVSPVHANFIVNHGHATAADVLALVRRVRARVKDAQGVELEPEVLLFGRRWEDVL